MLPPHPPDPRKGAQARDLPWAGGGGGKPRAQRAARPPGRWPGCTGPRAHAGPRVVPRRAQGPSGPPRFSPGRDRDDEAETGAALTAGGRLTFVHHVPDFHLHHVVGGCGTEMGDEHRGAASHPSPGPARLLLRLQRAVWTRPPLHGPRVPRRPWGGLPHPRPGSQGGPLGLVGCELTGRLPQIPAPPDPRVASAAL